MSANPNNLPEAASMSEPLKLTFDRAESFAIMSGDGTVYEAHLLASLCEDPDAITILLSNKIDIGKLRSTIGLGDNRRIDTRTSVPLGYSDEVKRLLILAIKTAMEIKLPQVDGAVFIAVMIGDKRNYSAKLLSHHGLTFEAVVTNLKTRMEKLNSNRVASSHTVNTSPSQTARDRPNLNSTDQNQEQKSFSKPLRMQPEENGIGGRDFPMTQTSVDEDVSQTDASFEEFVLSEQELPQSNNDKNPNRKRNGIKTAGQRPPDIRADLDEMEEFDNEDTNTSDSYYKYLKLGKLFENIPRSMRSMVSRQVEVRISEKQSQQVCKTISGVGEPHNILVTEAMSVQLRAPDGGFSVESQTPETQWIDNHLGLPNSSPFGIWRWSATPTSRGRHRLQVFVSARTVNEHGLVAENLLPEQIIEVQVKTNYTRQLKRFAIWMVAATGGGLLGKYGEVALQWMVSQN